MDFIDRLNIKFKTYWLRSAGAGNRFSSAYVAIVLNKKFSYSVILGELNFRPICSV